MCAVRSGKRQCRDDRESQDGSVISFLRKFRHRVREPPCWPYARLRKLRFTGIVREEGRMGIARTTTNYDALVQSDRVHGSVYTDPAIFEKEIDKIFSRGWVYVGHASEIHRPGDFRVTDIGHQSVIMVRDDDGQVRLLMNRCAHRANAVCQVERGNAKTFRCAYHGWTYRNNGDLAGITYQDRYDALFREEDHGLRKAPRMGIYRGFVFGSLSPAGIALDDHLGQQV